MNHSHTLAFIGGGNMASSLIGGLVKADYPPPELRVSDPDPQRVTDLKTRFGIAAMADNGAAVAGADAVVLAVKPQVLQAVARDLAAAVTAHRPLVVSVAAGVRLVDLNRWLGGGTPSSEPCPTLRRCWDVASAPCTPTPPSPLPNASWPTRS
ncbi:MAG: pyrroline-5-carboxylate reductase family protein [Candidatus Competibacterales bacterium]